MKTLSLTCALFVCALLYSVAPVAAQSGTLRVTSFPEDQPTGTMASTRVPLPGSEAIVSWPRTWAARSRMLSTP